MSRFLCIYHNDPLYTGSKKIRNKRQDQYQITFVSENSVICLIHFIFQVFSYLC